MNLSNSENFFKQNDIKQKVEDIYKHILEIII